MPFKGTHRGGEGCRITRGTALAVRARDWNRSRRGVITLLLLAIVGCNRVTNARQSQAPGANGVSSDGMSHTLKGNLDRVGTIRVLRSTAFFSAVSPSPGDPLLAQASTDPSASDNSWSATFPLSASDWTPFTDAREIVRLWVTDVSDPTMTRVLNVLPSDYAACEASRVAEWDSADRPVIPGSNPAVRHSLYPDIAQRAARLDLECFARPVPLEFLRPRSNIPSQDLCSSTNIDGPRPFTHDFLEGVVPPGQLPQLISYISPVGLASSGDIKGRHHIVWNTSGVSPEVLRQEFTARAPVAGRVVAVRKMRYAQCSCGTGFEPGFNRAIDDSYAIEVEYACGRRVLFDHLSRLSNPALRNLADGVWHERVTQSTGPCPTGTLPGKATVSLCTGTGSPRTGQGRACRTNDDCVGAGTCQTESLGTRCLQTFCPPGATRHCSNNHDRCETDMNCLGGGTCTSCGQCSNDSARACATDDHCENGGTCNLNATQTCGEPSQLSDTSEADARSLNIFVAAGDVVGYEQRNNNAEFIRSSAGARCVATAPAMDLQVRNDRADLAVQGIVLPDGTVRRYVSSARYQSDTRNGAYAAMRNAACPLSEYLGGPLASLATSYAARAGTGMGAADVCQLIHDVDGTLAGQWWSNHLMVSPNTPEANTLERIAFGVDRRSGVASISYFGRVGADPMGAPIARSIRYNACAVTVPGSPGECQTLGALAPTNLSTINRDYSGIAAATGSTSPVVLESDVVGCFDNAMPGSPMPNIGMGTFFRIRRTTDPWQIEVEVGDGRCAAPIGMSRRAVMHR